MPGVMSQALQLTDILPCLFVNGLPTIDWAGIYPSLEVLLPQLIFVAVIALVTVRQHGKE